MEELRHFEVGLFDLCAGGAGVHLQHVVKRLLKGFIKMTSKFRNLLILPSLHRRRDLSWKKRAYVVRGGVPAGWAWRGGSAGYTGETTSHE